MIDILFLGTGGGRFNLVRQLRGTGGFLLLGKSLTIHVDPGPGALLRLLQAGQDPTKTGVIIVTHMHVDHVSDAGVLTEAMSGFTFKHQGLLIAARSVLDGDKHGDRSISKYHQSLVKECFRFGPADSKTFEVKKEKKESGSAPHGSATFHLRGVPVKHDDKTGFGFVLEMDGVKIGYTSDTEYLPAIHNAAFSSPPHGLDVLIANNLKSAEDGIPDHLHSGDLIRLLKATKPKLCILSHMGMGLIQAGPEAEAARIESASGVKTIAGRDGYYYCTDRCGWFKAEKKKGKEEKEKAQKKLD